MALEPTNTSSMSPSRIQSILFRPVTLRTCGSSASGITRLNVGFRTKIAGETDFPCIDDARVGEARSYVKSDGPLSYETWIEGLKAGRSYVSEGRAHLMDYKIEWR